MRPDKILTQAYDFNFILLLEYLTKSATTKKGITNPREKNRNKKTACITL